MHMPIATAAGDRNELPALDPAQVAHTVKGLLEMMGVGDEEEVATVTE